MPDFDLDNILKSNPLPERPADFWEELPKRITTKIEWRRNQPGSKRKTPGGGRLLWWLAGALACVVIGFELGQWRSGRETGRSLQDQRFINEVLAMFTNQVQAIIQDEKGLQLSLADKPNVPSSAPLWIKVCDAQGCRSIVTFSGQVVQIAGRNVEVLAEAGGGVMLVGDRFFWSTEKSTTQENVQIRVHALGRT